MELKIYNPSEDGFIKEIKWNYDEIKAEVSAKMEHYKSLVYTDEQIQVAKADRATLNKFITALENKRKEIKKQCLAPYEAFERDLKEIIAIVGEPVKLIDSQVKTFEDQKKEAKLENILLVWNGIENKPEWLEIKQIFNEKWLNASVKISAVEKEINAKLEQIAKDLETLRNLPDFSFEAIEEYKHSLDVNKAISEGIRLADIQKRKAEQEQAEKEETEIVTTPDGSIASFTTYGAPDISADIPTAPMKQYVEFGVWLTVEEAKALKQFFNTNGIEYKKI